MDMRSLGASTEQNLNAPWRKPTQTHKAWQKKGIAAGLGENDVTNDEQGTSQAQVTTHARTHIGTSQPSKSQASAESWARAANTMDGTGAFPSGSFSSIVLPHFSRDSLPTLGFLVVVTPHVYVCRQIIVYPGHSDTLRSTLLYVLTSYFSPLVFPRHDVCLCSFHDLYFVRRFAMLWNKSAK